MQGLEAREIGSPPPATAKPAGLGLMVGLVLALAGVAGCQTTTSDEDIVPIDYEGVLELREPEREEQVVMVDVRSPRAHQQAHIPGAVNIPLPELDRGDPRLAEATRLIIYGADGRSGLAAAATKKLISLGYSNVYELRGGLARWREEGGEVVEPGAEGGEGTS